MNQLILAETEWGGLAIFIPIILLAVAFFLFNAWYEPSTTSEVDSKELKDTDQNTPNDETVKLLRQIEKNTRATHFWTRVTGIPVLIGIILFLTTAIKECA